MRLVKRYAPALGLLLALVLTLSGCIHADRSVQLNADGSGRYTFTLGFSDQTLSLAGSQFTQQMNACGEKVQAQGGSYRQFEDTGYGAWAFTWPFKNVSALNQLMQDTSTFCDIGGSSSSGSALSASDTDFFKVTKSAGFFATTFHATGQMSMRDQSGAADPSTAQLLKDARETFEITFPGYVSAHTGGSVSGNTVTYIVHYNESDTIDATGGALNTVAVGSVAALALIVVIGALLAFFLLRRRSGAQSEPEPVGVGAYGGPSSPAAFADDQPTLPSTTPFGDTPPTSER
jgi:hypothetical protein